MAEVDYQAVEHELCRIPEVSAARIVAKRGRPTEVHIVAAGDRQAGEVARDVQSVARATFGLDLDGKSISVVQIGAETGPESEAEPGDRELPLAAVAARPSRGRVAAAAIGPDVLPVAGHEADLPDFEFGARAALRAPSHGGNGHRTGSARDTGRIIVDRVLATRNGPAGTVDVELRSGDSTAVGRAAATTATSSMQRAAAAAALDALRQLEPATGRADVEWVTVARVGDRAVALVTVVVVLPPHEYEEALAGAAVVRTGGDLDAIARAVLDAMNRRMVILAAV